MDRPAARRDRADGLEDASAPGDAGRRCADHPGHHRARGLGRRGRGARRADRLSADHQGGGGRRRQGDEGRGVGRRPSRPSSRPSARGSRISPTLRSTSSATSRIRGTSRCRCSPTRTATSSTSASGTARSSAATRSSSRRRLRRPWARSCEPDRQDRGRRGARGRYRSAGTIEGLLAPDGSYYFMEMNTRIQVEHTITEVVAGVDIVRAQVQIAAGDGSSSPRTTSACGPRDRVPDQRRGCRQRLPAFAGDDHRVSRAGRPGVRVDSGVPRARRSHRSTTR